MPIPRSINALTTHLRANTRDIEAVCLEMEGLALMPDSRFPSVPMIVRHRSPESLALRG